MALDLKNIAPDARAAYIKDGERFSSEDTLEQANQTLNGYALHGSKLVAFGFASEDAAELTDGRDALIAAGVGREAKRTNKRIDTASYTSAMRDGQGVRLRARAVLSGALRVLGRTGATEAALKINALLERESVASDDAEGLAKQLDALAAMLNDPAVAAATSTRGGPQAMTDLSAQAKALRAVSQAAATPRGTPVETEKLDLLDGIIVSLVRSAREAAEAAARELGEPAIATAFALSALYKRKSKKKGEEPKGEKAKGEALKGEETKGEKAKGEALKGEELKGEEPKLEEPKGGGAPEGG